MKVIDQLLTKLVEMKGSDLHLIPGLPPGARVNGELGPFPGFPPMLPKQTKQHIYEVLTPEQIHLFETDQHHRNELDFAYSISGVGRFRFNVHVSRGSLACTVRALAREVPTIENLKLHPTCIELCKEKRGLVLVTGPTGSGKSTTLAAMIDHMNSNRAEHILTIEDPIEYVHQSKKAYVTQREVGEMGDTLSFKNALKFALRQDPDIILVGEMRDYETIGIAITAAETGHLVLGTLHTSSAAQTIGRIVDVFPTDQQPQVRTQLGSNLVATMSQVLFPRADNNGRVLAQEIMINNAAIRNNILSGKVEALNQIISTGQRDGMQSMDNALMMLAQQRLICYDDVEAYIQTDNARKIIEQSAPRRRRSLREGAVAKPVGVQASMTGTMPALGGGSPAAPPPPRPTAPGLQGAQPRPMPPAPPARQMTPMPPIDEDVEAPLDDPFGGGQQQPKPGPRPLGPNKNFSDFL